MDQLLTFGKKMLLQGTASGSQSNLINLAVSITYKIVRGFSSGFYIQRSL